MDIKSTIKTIENQIEYYRVSAQEYRDEKRTDLYKQDLNKARGLELALKIILKNSQHSM